MTQLSNPVHSIKYNSPLIFKATSSHPQLPLISNSRFSSNQLKGGSTGQNKFLSAPSVASSAKPVIIASEPEKLTQFLQRQQYFHDQQACRIIKNIDDLFNYFDQLSDQVSKGLIEQPQQLITNLWRSILSDDWQCQIEMGQAEPSLTARLEQGTHSLTSQRFFKCQGCQLILIITSWAQALSAQPFFPECGQKKDQQFIIQVVNNVIPKQSEEKTQTRLIQEINRQTHLAQACQPNLAFLQQARYYALDSFTNQILINWYLDKVLVKKNLPHLRKLYFPFICRQKGYLLLESNSYQSVADTKFDNVNQIWSLIFQLFALFHRLKNYDLSFQEINQQTILLENKSCQYEYDDMDISGSLTLKINDLSQAGITVTTLDDPGKPVRLYSTSNLHERQFSRQPSSTISWVQNYELAKSPGEVAPSWVSYIINPEAIITNKSDGFLYANRMGLPLYQSSFDVYRIMLLFCFNPKFYQFLTDDDHLAQIWRSFWLIEEYNLINQRIETARNNFDPATDRYPFIKILVGLHLRCNLVNHIWDLLKDEAYQQSGSEAS